MYGNLMEPLLRPDGFEPQRFEIMEINGWKLVMNVDGWNGSELLEIKTATQGMNVLDKYRPQIVFYIWGLQSLGYDVKSCKLRYVYKPDDYFDGIDYQNPDNYNLEVKDVVDIEYTPHPDIIKHYVGCLIKFCQAHTPKEYYENTI